MMTIGQLDYLHNEYRLTVDVNDGRLMSINLAGGDIMASEKDFENKIKKYLKDNNCYRVKYFGTAYSEAGTPDILSCVNGYFLAIEVKGNNGRVSDLQLEKINQIRKAGGFAYVVYPTAWEKIKNIINGLLSDIFTRNDEVILK